MEDIIKEKNKFVDNVAYKSKFQFQLWVNEFIICQRYFNIVDFDWHSIKSLEFEDLMKLIVNMIKNDLDSKSRIYMHYVNMDNKFKCEGFATKEVFAENEKAARFLYDDTNDGDLILGDKVYKKSYIDYGDINKSVSSEWLQKTTEENTFRFVFMMDDKTLYEQIWDGNVYPTYVRNRVDLANSFSNSVENQSMGFGDMIIRKLQSGKENLINTFIKMICFVLSKENSNIDNNEKLSNMFSTEVLDLLETYVGKTNKYTKQVVYRNRNNVDKERYENAVKVHGVIKPIVTGHIDIKPVTKTYLF